MEARKWSVAILLFLIIFFVIWNKNIIWNEKENVINEIPLFVNQTENFIHVIHLDIKKGNVSGIFYEYELIEDEPNLAEQSADITGDVIEHGYAIEFEKAGQRKKFLATIEDGVLLLMDKEAEKLEQYEPYTEEEFDNLLIDVKASHQAKIEEKETELKNWRNNFFEEFKDVYRYYTEVETEDIIYTIKIEDALKEGEWWGELQIIDQATEKVIIEYPLNGITDGNMLTFYLEEDEETLKYEGNFTKNVEEFEVEDKDGEKFTFKSIDKEALEQLFVD